MRRVIGVNAVHNDHDRMMRDHFNAPRTPFATRLRVGFAAPPPIAPVDWLPEMLATEHGVRRDDGIAARDTAPSAQRQPFCVAYGPYRCLRPGRYRLELDVRKEASRPPTGLIGGPLLTGAFQVLVGEAVTAQRRIHLIAPTLRLSLPVVIADDAFHKPVQARIISRGRMPFAVTGVVLTPQAAARGTQEPAA